MSIKTLHITNGDNTTDYLKKLNIHGEYSTWREMLCEGQTIPDVGSEQFWKIRFDFLKQKYRVSKKTFIDFTLKEYRMLCQKKPQEEIVLWFEYDLFCQINMIAVISWLKKYKTNVPVFLVCSGEVQGSKELKGLNELNEEQIRELYKNRVLLSNDDIEYADYIWQLYCADSPLRLEATTQLNQNTSFHYLEGAIDSHIKRFPSLDNGLNEIENQLLKLASEEQPKSKFDLVATMLKDQGNYGFGDLQYLNYLEELKKLFTSFSPVKLSRKGKQVLENQLNFYSELRSDDYYFGGAKKYSYLFVQDTGKLLQITN